ncbi:MAG: hypothetical protein IJD67_07105 [Clostridia bacterium]|nr:hypothetical protein [Clostridia bacterium]
MKTNTKKLSDEAKNSARLEYLLGRRELELEGLREELKGEREINSLCAAFLMYMLIKHSERNEKVLSYEINKEEANLLVGRYFSMCEDTGEKYKLSFLERDTSSEGDKVVKKKEAV